jgi:hypothetical protein
MFGVMACVSPSGSIMALRSSTMISSTSGFASPTGSPAGLQATSAAAAVQSRTKRSGIILVMCMDFGTYLMFADLTSQLLSLQ